MREMQQSLDGAGFAELCAFVAVAEDSSFARAGRRLGRDPTVVSRRIRALEARLGVRLLERTTRAVAITEAGAAYLARARAILRAMDEAEREAAAFATGEPRGHLRLALPSTFGRLWLAPLFAEFLARHPGVTAEAEFSNRFVDVIAEGFDAAVRLGVLADSRLVARKLGQRRRLLCAAPAYFARCGVPAHPSELATRACLVSSGHVEGPRWELRHTGGETARVTVSGPLASADAEALVAAALAGLGILLATDWLVGRELRDGRLVPVLPEWRLVDAGAIYAVTPSGSHRPSKTRAFVDFLAARLRTPPWLTEPGATSAEDPTGGLDRTGASR